MEAHKQKFYFHSIFQSAFLLVFCALLLTGLAGISSAQGNAANWIRETNIYEIFVDRFAKDLQGVKNKLGYLENLGVKTIWLMPIFKAMDDHGYNTTDYRDIEPRYGSINDLEELVEAAHLKNITVILDLVMNHCGADHPYFSSADPTKRKDHWFIWADSDLAWPDPWKISYSEDNYGKTWFKDPKAELDRNHNNNASDDDYYYSVFGDERGSTMPDFNFNDPVARAGLIDEFTQIMQFWIQQTDIDGFRCDAVRYIAENGSGRQAEQDETHQVWKEIRKRLSDIKPGAILIGEAPTETYDQMLQYYGQGDEFHSCFHFKFQGSLIATLKNGFRPFDLLSELYTIQGGLPSGTQDTIFLSNHDRFAGDRVATQLGNDTAKIKSAAFSLSSSLRQPGYILWRRNRYDQWPRRWRCPCPPPNGLGPSNQPGKYARFYPEPLSTPAQTAQYLFRTAGGDHLLCSHPFGPGLGWLQHRILHPFHYPGILRRKDPGRS